MAAGDLYAFDLGSHPQLGLGPLLRRVSRLNLLGDATV